MSSSRSGTWCSTIVLLAFFGGTAQALERGKGLTQYVAESWGPKDGLRQHRVRDILQTKDGYLWLATESGLVRFDGVRFTTFDSKSSRGFGHDYLHALAETDDGGLWVGTYHGLTLRKDGEFRTFTDADGLTDAFVWCVARGREGPWIGGWRGLSRYTGGRFTAHPRFQGQSIRTVLEARDGSLWVGVGRTLHHLEGEKATVYEARDGLPRDVRFTALVEAMDGALWIGTEQGLGRLSGGELRFYTTGDGLPSHNVQALLEDREGHLWIGTTAGLSRYDGAGFTRLAKGLSDDAVSALFEDREGSLWIGTPGGGLNRLKDGRFTPYGRPEGIRENTVWAVSPADDGTVWIGTDGGGVSRLSRDGVRTYTKDDGLPDDIAFAFARSHDGSLWVGMNTGVGRIVHGRAQAFPTTGLRSNSVRALLEDSRGRLWVGTSTGGLYRMAEAAFVAVRPPSVAEEHAYVSSILEGRDGSLWFGTDAGLWRLQGDTFTVYDKRNGLPGDYAAGMYEEADGTLWVATNPGGLARFKDGSWAVLRAADGLLDENINTVAEDGFGSMWFSTDRGIYSVSKRALDQRLAGRIPSVSSQAFDSHDGLRVAEGSAGLPAIAKAVDGRLWFATSRGAVVVDPRQLQRNPIPPPVYVEAVAVDGAGVSPRDGIEVGPGRGELEIQYTAPSLRVPERVRFKYRLEGFDTDWVDAGSRRVAYYTNLPPGRYRFRVLASNDDGVWNETGASLQMTLRPHFYQTRWFHGGIGGLFVLFGLAAHRLRVRRLEEREVELVRRVDDADARIKVLSGLLPICAACNKIRDEGGSWSRIESYIEAHSEANFSHGVCPDCIQRLYPEYAATTNRQQGAQ